MTTNSKLRILISRNSTGAIGGAELSAVDQVMVLNELGHQTDLLTGLKTLRAKVERPARGHVWLRAELFSGVLRHLWLLLMTPVTFLEAVFYATVLQPDIINPHSREDQIAFSLTKWLHRRPVVWKDPGDLRFRIKSERQGWLAQLNQDLLSAALRRADHVYLLNEADKDWLPSVVPGLLPNRLSVVPSSILFARYNRNAKTDKAEALVIGTAIQLDEQKGVQDLIAAYKLLDKADSQLWLVGDGAYRGELEKLAGEDERIKFFGHQTDISPYLAAMDIFVQPAHHEPWGRNIKEAMYFGKAIIGADSSGIAAQLRDGQTGLLYPPGNEAKLLEKLNMLSKDKTLRSKLGSAAKAEAEKRGDFKTIVEHQILPIYQSVLKERHEA